MDNDFIQLYTSFYIESGALSVHLNQYITNCIYDRFNNQFITVTQNVTHKITAISFRKELRASHAHLPCPC